MIASICQASVNYYVINLRSAEERRIFMREQAAHFGLRLQFIEAVSGTNIPPEENLRYDTKKAEKYSNYRLIPNEIACALSHRKALIKFLGDGVDFGVVLEDDAILQPHFTAAIDELINRISGWDVVKLEFRSPGKFFPLRSIRHPDSVFQPVFVKNFSFGATGFMYTRRAAKIILHDMESFFLPADTQIAEIILRRKLHVIAPFPPIVIENHIPSTIDSEKITRTPLPSEKRFSSLMQHARHSCHRHVNSLRKVFLYLKILRNINYT